MRCHVWVVPLLWTRIDTLAPAIEKEDRALGRGFCFCVVT